MLIGTAKMNMSSEHKERRAYGSSLFRVKCQMQALFLCLDKQFGKFLNLREVPVVG